MSTTNPHTDIILSVRQAIETGWYGSFAMSPSGDSYNVEIASDGEIDVDSDSEQAQDLAREFAASWRAARAFGMDAIAAVQLGDLENALRYTAAAASEERYWGDDPVWALALGRVACDLIAAAAAAIRGAADLEGLAGALQAAGEIEAALIEHAPYFARGEIYDPDSLPTFGGEEPGDCLGVYSWDPESVLVYEGGGDWRIEPRDKAIRLDSEDFDGDSARVSSVTVDDVIDLIAVEVEIDGRAAGETVEGDRWYLHAEAGAVYLVDLDRVIDRGLYYGGLKIDFAEGDARCALQARRRALFAE
jgi:hypothetical protein